jgi:hypothetical protein
LINQEENNLNKKHPAENISLHKILDNINSNSTITAEKKFSSDKNITKAGAAVQLVMCFWRFFITGKNKNTGSRLINSVLASSDIFLSNIKLLRLKGKL